MNSLVVSLRWCVSMCVVFARPLCELLQVNDVRIITVALEGLKNILKVRFVKMHLIRRVVRIAYRTAPYITHTRTHACTATDDSILVAELL